MRYEQLQQVPMERPPSRNDARIEELSYSIEHLKRRLNILQDPVSDTYGVQARTPDDIYCAKRSKMEVERQQRITVTSIREGMRLPDRLEGFELSDMLADAPPKEKNAQQTPNPYVTNPRNVSRRGEGSFVRSPFVELPVDTATYEKK